MRWCDNHDVSYIFGLARNQILERRIGELLERAESTFKETGTKQRLFGETQYARFEQLERRQAHGPEHRNAGGGAPDCAMNRRTRPACG